MAGSVGVLALQGSFQEHLSHLKLCGVEGVRVRLPEHLEGLDALIIPGGESTTMGKLANHYELIAAIKAFASTKPIWGTCAGLILLAKNVGAKQPLLGLMDITVKRNAFGRQLDSFVDPLKLAFLDTSFPGVFIRAPIIASLDSPDVEALGRLPDGRIIAAKQGNLLATCFHPELTQDLRVHKFFINLLNP